MVGAFARTLRVAARAGGASKSRFLVKKTRLGMVVFAGLLSIAVLGLAACESQKVEKAQGAAVTEPRGRQSPALRPLSVEPPMGRLGDSITVSGTGFPPGQEVRFEWATRDGSYVTEASPATVRVAGRAYVEKRGAVGKASADAQGKATITFAAPGDFGGAHDIYAVAGGKDSARGTFRTLSSALLAPASGPVGTPVTITVRGIGWEAPENTLALLYDNKYTGLVTAVTTHGTAVVRFRAAGPPGTHTVRLVRAAPGSSYPNLQPVGSGALDFSWTFRVTGDGGAPADLVDWPSGSRVSTLSAAIPRIMAGGSPAGQGAVNGLEPPYGVVGSPTSLWARGLPPSAEVNLVWVTAQGDQVTQRPVGKAATGPDGSLRTGFEVPDVPGGWHVVKAVLGDKVLLETPYYLQRSIAEVSARKVRAGEAFTVRLKGIGWTGVDNAVAITYDNAYIGYACGEGCRGDITLTLTASGAPGTHLIDLYPMVHRPEGGGPLDEQIYHLPYLTALQDHPGQRLGYELPVIRLAIEVIA